MGKENDKDASANPDRKDRRKRLRESGSQTEEEEHQFEFGGSCDELARLNKINSKLDKFLQRLVKLKYEKKKYVA